MTQKKYILISCVLLFCLAGCKKRNFFPDEDDPGLSILTSYGYNVATNYINDKPYINPFFGVINGNSHLFLQKIITNSTFDTLSLSWQIQPHDISMISSSPYQNISLLMPIPKSFSQDDFLALSGRRFSSNNNTILINAFLSYPHDILSGLSNIYFVKINVNGLNSSTKNFIISGLFDGNIGDSIVVTKGRFDFEIPASSLNF
jgi:hypothetical protein